MSGCSNYPLVSVIINCYNGEKYLREAIDSIYAQSYKNWEIIFWDNCSNDNSRIIAESYDKKLRYFKSDINTKLGLARNMAIKKCKGLYIAFLDTDDYWYNNKLDLQIERMIIENTSISYTGCDIGITKELAYKFVPKYSSGFIFDKLLNQFEINLPTAIIKKTTLVEMGVNFNTDIEASEEYDLFIQIAAIHKVTVINDCTCFYRISSNSLTNKSINFRSKDRAITLITLRRNYKQIVESNKISFNFSKYKIWYYRFQAALYNGNIEGAKYNLKKIIFKDKRYFLIYITLLVSPSIYTFFLKKYDKRGF